GTHIHITSCELKAKTNSHISYSLFKRLQPVSFNSLIWRLNFFYMKKSFLFVSAILMQHAAVQAQTQPSENRQTPLNEVIINENRLQIPFASQNRNIYILDKDQIDNLPVQSVNELLSYVS